jgi:predicted GNAT family acetyltransferase
MHTETMPGFTGRGLARKLIEYALDQVREQGLWVLPFCPFVVKIVAERPEYLALVPGDLRANFDLPAGS